MLFTSAIYLLVFLPATFVVYWLAPSAWRVPILLVASYVFYLSWNAEYGLLLAGSTIVNYALAKAMPHAARRKALLTVAIVFNLAVLVYFKYAGLFTDGAADLLDWLGLASSGGYDGLQILLPLAISFFTFEMISFQVDIYRGQAELKGFIPFATYKAYFPKLISGPITRWTELGPQLLAPRPLTIDRFGSGAALLTLGLAKKLAISDNLAAVADPVFANPAAQTPVEVAIGVVAFGLQIYFDFSGYTDMARGTSRMFGLELPLNFRFPYAATGPSDFWKRWNITLSRFLQDYLYISLGGNRKGRAKTYRNLMITMCLGGLWHGAGWQFVAWGALHGTMLCIAHALRGYEFSRAWRLAGAIATLFGVFIAWVFFRATDLANAFDVLGVLVELPAALTVPETLLAVAAVFAFVAANRAAPRIGEILKERTPRDPMPRGVTFAVAVVVCWSVAVVLSRSSLVPFVYFQF